MRAGWPALNLISLRKHRALCALGRATASRVFTLRIAMFMPKGGQGILSWNLHTTITGVRIAPLAPLVGVIGM